MTIKCFSGKTKRRKKLYVRVVIFLYAVYGFLMFIQQLQLTLFEELHFLGESQEKSLYVPPNKKFITANFNYCGGLGNQMFHFIVYYGIGQSLGRHPMFYADKECEVEAAKELTQIFPHIEPHLTLLKPLEKESKIVDNMEDFSDFEKLAEVTEKYLIFKDYVRHFYKFFEEYKNDVRFFLDFNKTLKLNVTILANEMFGNDRSHKFCIHTRRSDFLSPIYPYVASDSSFIIPATNHIHEFLKAKSIKNISLVIMGEDDVWKRSLPIDKSLFHNIYYPLFPLKDQDMAFGAMKCDSFLISASASSFAFWMAFLMPEGNPVFYNSDLYKNGNNEKFPYSLTFPSHWNKLEF